MLKREISLFHVIMLRNYDSIFHGCAMVCHEWRDGVPAMNPALAGAASC